MPAAAQHTAASPPSSLTDLKHMKVAELAKLARSLEIEAAGAMKKQDLIFAILQAQSKAAEEKKEEMEVGGEGTLEVLPDGFGLPPQPRLQLPARPGRHLRLALADPPLQPAHRRHGARDGAPAEGRRALLRAPQGRLDQRRAARGEPGEGPLRQPDAALPDQAAHARARPERDDDAGRRPVLADRQGAALPHRLAAARRQDRPPPEHRARGHREPPRGAPSSCCSSTSGPRRSPTWSGR